VADWCRLPPPGARPGGLLDERRLHRLLPDRVAAAAHPLLQHGPAAAALAPAVTAAATLAPAVPAAAALAPAALAPATPAAAVLAPVALQHGAVTSSADERELTPHAGTATPAMDR